MLSTSEEDYLKSLINSYFKKGYKYYLCHTVTEANNEYDFYVYFSKEEIKAITPTSFDLTSCIKLRIDSSQRNDNSYNPSTHSRISLVDSSLNDVISINQAEFIYTNAKTDYETTTLVVQPDISYPVNSSYGNSMILIILIVTFLYTFVSNILRIRR